MRGEMSVANSLLVFTQTKPNWGQGLSLFRGDL